MAMRQGSSSAVISHEIKGSSGRMQAKILICGNPNRQMFIKGLSKEIKEIRK